MVLFDILFSWCKFYRKLRKGTWTLDPNFPMFPNFWLRNYKPLIPRIHRERVAHGFLIEEVYE